MPSTPFLLRGLLPATIALPVLVAIVGLPAAQATGSHPTSGTVAPKGTACAIGSTVVDDVMPGENWAPLTPSKWQFPGSEVILAEAGTAPSGPRRPFEFAVLQQGPEFGSVTINADVRLDTPVEVSNRDVIIIFGYQSPTRFYYAHLSTDNTIYPHNGIFLVNDADRLRLDDQWTGSVGAPPAITDAEYHDATVRHCSATGEIAVFVDGAATPLMTATDTTLKAGRVGFGSFDNVGRMRDLTVTGTPGCQGAEATIVGTRRADYLAGSNSSDIIATLSGNDVVLAKGGDDVVCGGDGNDLLFGQSGDDSLLGEAGRDLLVGGPGADTTRQD